MKKTLSHDIIIISFVNNTVEGTRALLTYQSSLLFVLYVVFVWVREESSAFLSTHTCGTYFVGRILFGFCRFIHSLSTSVCTFTLGIFLSYGLSSTKTASSCK